MQPEQPTIVAAIVTSQRGVLLGRRTDNRPPWTFPGGAMEAGETVQDTAVRECLEETGLAVVAHRIIGDRVHPKTGRHMAYVACRPANGTTDVIVGDPEELAEVVWRDLADLDELMPYGVFEPVAEHLRVALSPIRLDPAVASLLDEFARRNNRSPDEAASELLSEALRVRSA